MSTKKNNKQEAEKYKEPFKITVNRTGKNKSELSVQEVKPFAPTIPVIDLTPSALLMRYDKEKLISKFAMTAVSIAAIFGLVWGANLAIGGIQTNSNAATLAQIDTLQKQLGAVEGYRVYADGIKLVREDMYNIIRNNIDMGVALGTVVDSAQANNVSITNIKVTETATSSDQNVCVNSEPFKTTIQVGCININGTASNNSAVIKFFADVLKTKGFGDSFINSIGVTGNKVIFNGTISITDALKIKRYDYLSTELVSIDSILGVGGLSDGTVSQILSAANGAKNTPAGTDTSTPSATPSSSTGASASPSASTSGTSTLPTPTSSGTVNN